MSRSSLAVPRLALLGLFAVVLTAGLGAGGVTADRPVRILVADEVGQHLADAVIEFVDAQGRLQPTKRAADGWYELRTDRRHLALHIDEEIWGCGTVEVDLPPTGPAALAVFLEERARAIVLSDAAEVGVAAAAPAAAPMQQESPPAHADAPNPPPLREFDGGDLRVDAQYKLGTPAAGATARALNTSAYSNITAFTGQALPQGPAQNQAGNIITRLVADDLNFARGAGQEVVQFTFSVANFNTVQVAARPRARFWFPDGAGGGPGTYYNGSNPPANVGFTFNPVTFNPNSVVLLTATLAPGQMLIPGQTLWAGLTFDNNTGATGATQAQMSNLGQGIFDPPTVGHSQDRFFITAIAGSFFGTNNPAGNIQNLGGNPVANFGWEFQWKSPPVTIPPGEDCWTTECGPTQFDFRDTPIPCSFFDPGSEPFDGVVLLGGNDPGLIDTRVGRLDQMVFDKSLPEIETVPIEIVALDLRSCSPITVRYCTGEPDELWNVFVDLSVAPPPPPGLLTVTKTHDNGGTFTSQFFVQPRFTFVRQSDGEVRQIDTGLFGFPPLLLQSTQEAPWVHQATIPVGPEICGINFVPGVQEANVPPTGGSTCVSTAQCCKPVGHGSGGGHLHVTGHICTPCPCGACCNPPDGACTEISSVDPAGDCAAMGGAFKGIGSSCVSADGDAIPDAYETGDPCGTGTCGTGSNCSSPTSPTRADSDGDGLPDHLDPEPANRCLPQSAPGRPAICDQFDQTLPGDGDCNDDGVCDLCAIRSGASHDCNVNGVPDECEPDCNFNALPDDYDITCGGSLDANNNGTPDECEPVGGGACCVGDGTCVTALDPADCESMGGKFYGFGTTCQDNDGDGIPDVSEINDCAAPHVLQDLCHVRSDPFNPNTDGDPWLDGDEAYALGTDPCFPDADCNSNLVPDQVELTQGARQDRNNNGVPDSCEYPRCQSGGGDTNADGVINGLDIQEVVNCHVGILTDCTCVDMDGDDFITNTDLDMFVTVCLNIARLPRCDNCHAINDEFWECHHWANSPNGFACSTNTCIRNVVNTAGCDFHPGRSGNPDCDTDKAGTSKWVQTIIRGACPGGAVLWVERLRTYQGCDKECFLSHRIMVSCVTQPCSGPVIRGPFDRGRGKRCGCP